MSDVKASITLGVQAEIENLQQVQKSEQVGNLSELKEWESLILQKLDM